MGPEFGGCDTYPEAGSHEFAGREGAPVGGPPLTDDFLVVVAADTDGPAAHGQGGAQGDVLALDLHEEVDAVQVELDSAGHGVDIGDQLLAIDDLDAAAQRFLVTVDGDGTSGVDFDDVLLVDDGDDLATLSLTSQDGEVVVLPAVGDQDVVAAIEGVVVGGSVESVDGPGSDEALGLGDVGQGQTSGALDEAVTSLQGVPDLLRPAN